MADAIMNRGPVLARRTFLGAIAAAGATVLAGCSFDSTGSGGAGSGAALKTLVVSVSQNIDSLDPHYVNNGALVTPWGLLEGLVATDDKGSGVVPAIAEKWDVSADGLKYTFHLRSNAKFSNGDPITAKDFEWTYQRLLAPTGAGSAATDGANSYKPSLGIVGATDFLAGTITDWSKVGIKATADDTLEITLATPNSAFLLGMANVSMLLLHKATIEKHPKDWMQPENWVGSGPYALTAWTPTASIAMKKHSHYWDADNIHVDAVQGRVLTDNNAALLAYRNNEIQVTVPNFAVISKDKDLMNQVQEAPGYLVYFLQSMFTKHPAGADARVRQALGKAIDRKALAKIAVGQLPGPSTVPQAVPGWDKSLAIDFDLAGAKKLLDEAGYAGGKGMPTIQILDFASNPFIEATLQMWEELGVKTKYNIVDVGQYSDIRYKPIEDPNLWGYSANTFGGLPTWNNWVIDCWGPASLPFFSLPTNQVDAYLAIQADESLDGATKTARLASMIDSYGSPEAKRFVKLANAAAAEPDESTRIKGFNEAAGLRQQMGYQIPLMWGPNPLMVKPTVKNLHVNYSPSGFYVKGIEGSK